MEFAWRQYEQSGDRAFLAEAYDELFRKLYWDGLPGCLGLEINALDALVAMATALERDADAVHWKAMRPKMVRGFRTPWEACWPQYHAGKGTRWKDIWHLASLMCAEMPDEWARGTVERWVMNTETGFYGPVPLDVRPPGYPENGPFAVSTISMWLAIEGMFRRGCAAEAVQCTLGHLGGMVRDHGFPVTPECWDPDYKPWGSMYYNWCGAVNCLLLERLAGISYSLPNGTFRVRDHLPDAWQYVETRTPVVQGQRVAWTKVRIERSLRGDQIVKSVEVENCPLQTLIVEPWLEDRALISSTPASDGPARNRVASFRFEDGGDRALSLVLGKRTRTFNALAYLTPHGGMFRDSVTVTAQNLVEGTTLRYTTDGAEPTAASPAYTESLTFTRSTALRLRAFSDDGTVYAPMAATYTRAELREAADPGPLRPGIRYESFEGEWRALPNFESLTPKAAGIAEAIDLARAPRNEHFAMRFSRYIHIPEDDLYTFQVRSNDGCRLIIDGVTVVNLDVLCGRDAWEDSGQIGLRAGKHSFTVLYFQHATNKDLRISYTSEQAKKPVLGSALFHSP